METDNHNTIMMQLGKLEQIGNDMNSHLAQLNGSVAKHEARFGSQDVLNAQTALTLAQVVESMKEVRKGIEANSEFRISANGSINTIKWLLGFVGIGTIVLLFRSIF